MLFDKENTIQLHKVKTLQTTHTDQNAIKLEVKNTIKNVKSLPTWKMFVKQLIEKIEENRNYQTSE